MNIYYNFEYFSFLLNRKPVKFLRMLKSIYHKVVARRRFDILSHYIVQLTTVEISHTLVNSDSDIVEETCNNLKPRNYINSFSNKK